MSIDWTHFTPLSALIGGLLIGIAAAMFVLINGRVAGISSIAGGLLRMKRNDFAWRAAFVIGMIAAPLAYRTIAPLPPIRIDANWSLLVFAGVLVGLGSRYGSGCTSGHGVCGLASMSPRSMVATLTFMGAGFVTVYLVRHMMGG